MFLSRNKKYFNTFRLINAMCKHNKHLLIIPFSWSCCKGHNYKDRQVSADRLALDQTAPEGVMRSVESYVE